MTWGEFKKALEQRGVEDHHVILWVDVQGDESVLVEYMEEGIGVSSGI
jgi:hypothetical protein